MIRIALLLVIMITTGCATISKLPEVNKSAEPTTKEIFKEGFTAGYNKALYDSVNKFKRLCRHGLVIKLHGNNYICKRDLLGEQDKL